MLAWVTAARFGHPTFAAAAAAAAAAPAAAVALGILARLVAVLAEGGALELTAHSDDAGARLPPP